MMRKLDKSRPFGTITPLYIREDFDRPAQYEQDNCFFDQHGREIVPGQPLVEKAAPKRASRHPLDHDGDGRPGGSVPAGDVAAPMTAADLLAQADTLAWHVFKKHAKLILGDKCPASKAAIVVELENAIKKHQERRAKRQTTVEEGEGEANPQQTNSATKPQDNGSGVDLAAWGRGQKDYLFGEIQKVIRATYHKQVTERRDAVDFLIEQGVIRDAEARSDV